jgi:hypothetical protein
MKWPFHVGYSNSVLVLEAMLHAETASFVCNIESSQGGPWDDS